MDGKVTVYFKELMVVGEMKHTKKKGKRILLCFVGATVCNCVFVWASPDRFSVGAKIFDSKDDKKYSIKWISMMYDDAKDNRTGNGILPRAHWHWLAPLFMLG